MFCTRCLSISSKLWYCRIETLNIFDKKGSPVRVHLSMFYTSSLAKCLTTMRGLASLRNKFPMHVTCSTTQVDNSILFMEVEYHLSNSITLTYASCCLINSKSLTHLSLNKTFLLPKKKKQNLSPSSLPVQHHTPPPLSLSSKPNALF